jgi:hypothetical protein
MPPIAVHWQTTLTALATTLAAIGTIGAVCVVLFIQPWRERRRRPGLSLSLGRNHRGFGMSHDLDPAPLAVTLRITAAPNHDPALDAEVLVSVASHQPGKPSSKHTFIDHQPLRWYEAYGEGDTTRLRLAPGIEREVELLRIARPSRLYRVADIDNPSTHATISGVLLSIPPVNSDTISQRLLSDRLTYIFTIYVTASNADTVTYTIGLRTRHTWDGRLLDPSSGSTPPADLDAANSARMDVYLSWSKLLAAPNTDAETERRGGWLSVEHPEDLEAIDDRWEKYRLSIGLAQPQSSRRSDAARPALGALQVSFGGDVRPRHVGRHDCSHTNAEPVCKRDEPVVAWIEFAGFDSHEASTLEAGSHASIQTTGDITPTGTSTSPQRRWLTCSPQTRTTKRPIRNRSPRPRRKNNSICSGNEDSVETVGVEPTQRSRRGED